LQLIEDHEWKTFWKRCSIGNWRWKWVYLWIKIIED
jgi:hypothetical protein